jgi:hypothetical protein
MMPSPLRRAAASTPPDYRQLAQRRAVHRPFDRHHAVGRPHEIAKDGEHWQSVRRAVGERYRYDLLSLARLRPKSARQRKDHSGRDAMAAAKQCRATKEPEME